MTGPQFSPPSRRSTYRLTKPALCLPESERRTFQINVSLNAAEVEQLDRLRGHLTRAAFLRRALNSGSAPGQRMVPEINRAAYAELARLSANLNQMMKYLNQARIAHGDQFADTEFRARQAAFAELLTRTLSAVAELRLAMIGAKTVQ